MLSFPQMKTTFNDPITNQPVYEIEGLDPLLAPLLIRAAVERLKNKESRDNVVGIMNNSAMLSLHDALFITEYAEKLLDMRGGRDGHYTKRDSP